VLTSALILIGLLMWYRAIDPHARLGSWIAFSLVSAVATLTQPILLPILIFAFPAITLLKQWRSDVRLRNGAVLFGAIAVVWLPWIARNTTVHGRTVITTRAWQNLWATSNPNATGSDRLPLTAERLAAAGSLRAATPEDHSDASNIQTAQLPMTQADLLTPQQRSELAGRNEIEREKCFAQWANESLAAGTSPWLRQLPIRLIKGWFIDWDHPMSRHPLAMAPRAAIVTIATAGLIVALMRRLPVGPVLVVLLTIAFMQGLTIASAKTAIVMEPLQMVLAVTVVSVLATRRAARFAPASRRAHADWSRTGHVDLPSALPLAPSQSTGRGKL
jgi:hypothetical protein